jgi:hypothetical protein
MRKVIASVLFLFVFTSIYIKGDCLMYHWTVLTYGIVLCTTTVDVNNIVYIYIIMWSCPGNMPRYYPGLRDILPSRSCPGNMPKYYTGLGDILPDRRGRVICLSDLGNILAYYLDKTTLISLLYWVSTCPGNMPKYYPGNMPKYYSTKYHYRNLHEV